MLILFRLVPPYAQGSASSGRRISVRHWISFRNHWPVEGFFLSLTGRGESDPALFTYKVAQFSSAKEYGVAMTVIRNGFFGE